MTTWRLERFVALAVVVAGSGCADNSSPSGAVAGPVLDMVAKWRVASRADVIGGAVDEEGNAIAWTRAGAAWYYPFGSPSGAPLVADGSPLVVSMSTQGEWPGIPALSRETGEFLGVLGADSTVALGLSCADATDASRIAVAADRVIATFKMDGSSDEGLD